MNKLKIRLKNFTSRIDVDEHIQEVEYNYSIEDMLGMLKIELTIPEEVDPVEEFIHKIVDLNKNKFVGIVNYEILHNHYKYYYDAITNNLSKIKMY